MDREVFSGVVISFDERTTYGVVLVSGCEIPFPSTSFRAKRCPRFPRPGDEVEVVLGDDGRVLGVSTL